MAEATSSPGMLKELELIIPSDHTIHEASELMCSFEDCDDHASHDFHMAGNLLGRINPGQALQPPKTLRHTDQLYADHAERAQRLQKKRELANLDKAESEMLQRRHFVRRGNENELGQVCQRLYEDARRRRQDAVRKNIERQMREDEERKVHAFGENVVAAAHNGTPRWQALYDEGLQRRKDLDEKRQLLQKEEIQRLQEESLHSRGAGDEAQGKVKEVIDRLMEDSRRRINVQSRRARMAKEEVLRRQAGQQFSSLADLQDGINRLYYQDQQKRQEKFQQQTEALRIAQREMLLSGSRVLSVEEANARFNQLYDDALRREEVRRQATERALREEEESLREQSVHAAVLQKHWQPAEVQEIFDRIATGRGSPPDSSDTVAKSFLTVEIRTVIEEASGCTEEVEADNIMQEGASSVLEDPDGTPRQLPEAHALPPMAVSCSNLDVADAGAGPLRPSTTLQMPAGKGHPGCRTATPLRAQRSEDSGELPGGLLPPPQDPPDPQRQTVPSASSPLCGEKTPEGGDNKAKPLLRAATTPANENGIRGAIEGRGYCLSQAAQPEVQRYVARAATLRQPLKAVTPQKLVASSVTSSCLRTPPGVQLGP